MKRNILLIMIATLAISCAACSTDTGKKDPSENPVESGSVVGSEAESEYVSETESETLIILDIKDATDLLTQVWNSYDKEEMFMCVGGHYEAYTDEAPAKYDLTKAADMERIFCIPQDVISYVDDAATLQHAQNVNNFSAAVYHVTDVANVQTLIDRITQQTLANKWLNGRPERLVVYTVGEQYVVTAYGSKALVINFAEKLEETYYNVPERVVKEDIIK